jgi:putative hemolysin
MKKIFFILGAVLSLVVFLSGCQNNSAKKSAQTPKMKIPEISENKNNADQTAGLANPASQNCVQKGGTLEMRKNKNGEYGVCFFEDNRQCEEWALFNGQCPIGGVKITGYENDAEIYCAITGGQVEDLGTETPMCKRIDGTYCNAQANFDGECPNPNNLNPDAGNIETQ